MEKTWLKSYPAGVKSEIDQKNVGTIVDVLDDIFRKFKDRPAFHNMGTTISYERLEAESARFASFLQNELKLEKGARVALMMPNILQYPIALFGVLRAGMVAVNVNPLYTKRELEHQLKDSGSEVIVVFKNAAHLVEAVQDKTPLKHVIVTGLGDMLDFPKSLIVNVVIKYVKKMIPAYSLPDAINFKYALAVGDMAEMKSVEVAPSDTAFLQYTGGTTGVSKGAVLSHSNIASNIAQAKMWIGEELMNEDGEIIITPLPLYHIFSLTANCFVYSSIGAMNVLITNPRDMDGFVKELKNWKFNVLTGVNTLFNGLVHNEEFKNVDFSSFRLALGGGMAVQRAVAEKWKEVTGVPIIEAYGLTETSPAACMNPMNLPEFNGSIGVPIPSTDVIILSDDEKPLPMGEIGEISIRGPQVMKGYWKRPEETAKVMTADGFFKTGDLGTVDENGYFRIVDRKKDMILVSGFNVFPNEVEEVIVDHPKVLEAAAIGIPNENSGEIVKAFIVKKDNSLTEDEIKAFCKENLTGYKVPKEIEFRDDLPKSNVGKILRKELRPQPPQ